MGIAFPYPQHLIWKVRGLASRVSISLVLVAVPVMVCLRLPHVDHATAALLLVLSTVGLAKMWGRGFALATSIIGGLIFDYYALPPRGFKIASPEQLVALLAFLATACITGQLAAHSEQRQIEAVKRRDEMERLYRLVNALLESGDSRSTVSQLPHRLAEIFGADGVALYDRHTDLILRAGPQAHTIPDEALRKAASNGHQLQTASTFTLAPIRHGSELMGSVAMAGGRLSESLLAGIAGRIGLGLARLYAIEKASEAEVMRRSEELKSAVLDAVAHEIRNPLNSIKLAATSLLSDQPGNDMQTQEMAAIIDEEADRMDRSIDEAVQLARAEASELSTLNTKPQNIAQLIPAAIAEMGAAARRRQVEVSVPETLPEAECDSALITRVLKQIVGNALKYSPDGSPVTVSAEFTGNAVVIDVVDRGPGVDREERNQIFEKYYRGRAARAGIPGTGLGLASARSIVRAHGGEVWVTSPPAGGAAFHVSLPVAGKAVTG